MAACRSGKNPLVKMLLDAGAEINAQTNDGETALMTAARWYNRKTIQLLIENGADVDIKDNEGKTALDRTLDTTTRKYLKMGNK